jgi:type I restriction enzyme R subunit
MAPEEKARLRIDSKLDDAGWKVCNRDEFSPSVSALAVREGIMQGGLEADYLLFINGKAVGVLEAKRVEVDLVQVAAAQAENYTTMP